MRILRDKCDLVPADIVQKIALYMPALFISFTVHEYAHARVASALGDPTPERQERLTLSPLAHIDPIGSIVFPLALLISTGSTFGWARPVQFNPANFSRRWSMRTGEVLTTIAGPGSNLVLALFALIGLRLLFTFGTPSGTSEMVEKFLNGLFSLNVALAVFNLFPLPPLDGGHLLPPSMNDIKEFLSRYSIVFFALIFFISIPGLPGGTIGHTLMQPVMTLVVKALQAIAFIGS